MFFQFTRQVVHFHSHEASLSVQTFLFTWGQAKGSKTAVKEALNVEFWSLVHATPKNGVANVTGWLLHLVNDSFERDKLS